MTLLAPEIVEAILDGRQPAELQLDDLLEGFPLESNSTELAHAIVEGHDLATASGLLGVSVNTLRTQLQAQSRQDWCAQPGRPDPHSLT